VALCDSNPSRLELSASHIPDHDGAAVGLYDAGEFDRMVAERRPDTFIVTTPDDLHDTYVLQALRAGCDVITEKPMTIDLAKSQQAMAIYGEWENGAAYLPEAAPNLKYDTAPIPAISPYRSGRLSFVNNLAGNHT
jgi:hypothetical protein